MSIHALGYLGIGTLNLDDWADFGQRFLGLQLIERTKSTLAFRMDDRSQRIVVSSTAGEAGGFYGWEVANAAGLDHVAARLDSAGVKVTQLSRALCDQRRAAEILSFHDPIGNCLEVFHGPEISTDPFQPARPIEGFRTGPLGMGHIVLTVERIDKVLPFYTEILGLHLSDYVLRPFKAYFMHVNSRHHSLAFAETGKNGVHHLMMELFSLDDVGQTYDIALCEEGRIATTLGRHSNDYMTSFYANTPSDFMVEYGWGGRSIDVDTWKSHEVSIGPSMWGHDRAWLTPEEQKEARELRMRAAASGLHAPLEISDEYRKLAPGACTWWDSVKGERGPNHSVT